MSHGDYSYEEMCEQQDALDKVNALQEQLTAANARIAELEAERNALREKVRIDREPDGFWLLLHDKESGASGAICLGNLTRSDGNLTIAGQLVDAMREASHD